MGDEGETKSNPVVSEEKDGVRELGDFIVGLLKGKKIAVTPDYKKEIYTIMYADSNREDKKTYTTISRDGRSIVIVGPPLDDKGVDSGDLFGNVESISVNYDTENDVETITTCGLVKNQ